MEDQQEKLINKNKVEEADISDDDSMEDEDEDEFKNEDYDPNIKDDILKPASTRSKIVVNLKDVKDEALKYELDPYDRVRMRLIFADEMLFKAYEKTIQ